MNVFNDGDRVVIGPLVIGPDIGQRTNTMYWDVDVNSVDVETKILPFTPALPAVVRWLAETPDSQRVLGVLLEEIRVTYQHYEWDGDFKVAMSALESLVDALEGS